MTPQLIIPRQLAQEMQRLTDAALHTQELRTLLRDATAASERERRQALAARPHRSKASRRRSAKVSA